MNSITGLSAQRLRQAADIKERIDALQTELSEILDGEVPTPLRATQPPKKKRKMSAAGRRAIAAAARARWARYNAARRKPAKKARRKLSAQGLANIRAGVSKRVAAQAKAAASRPARKVKKHYSAAARAALAASAKARWARAKAAGKTTI